MKLHQRYAQWKKYGRLVLGTNAKTGEYIALTKKTLSLSHMHVIGPTGSGKTTGLMEPWEVLLLDPDIPAVVLDNKPGGDVFYKMQDFCITHGLMNSVEIIDFSDRSCVTGYSPLVPDERSPAFHAKGVLGALTSGAGMANLDGLRQLSRFTHIGLYAARLFNLNLEDAWRLLKPISPEREKILYSVPDEFLQGELLYIESLSKSQREVLLASSSAFLESCINEPYLRACFTAPITFRMQKALQEKKKVLINTGHGVSVTSGDARQLSRFIVNDILVSVVANRGQYGDTHVLLDECQLALTPEIATIGLETGRSLGLRVWLSHQYLHQLKSEDETGRIYAGVKSQCRVKLVFGGVSKEDLDELVQDRVGEINIYKRKHTLYGLETVQTEETRLVRARTRQGSESHGITFSESETIGESDSETYGTSRTRAEGENRQRSKTKTAGVVAGRGHARGRGTTRVASRARTAGTAASWAEGTAESSSWADGSGLTMGDSMSMGESMPILPDGGEGIVTTFTGSGSNMVQSSVSTAGGGVSHSRMRGGSSVAARTEGEAAGTTDSLVSSESSANHNSEGEGESASWSSSESEGENASSSHTTSRSVTRGRSPSHSTTVGWSESEAVTPFMSVEQRRVPTSIAYVPPEEQMLEMIQEMRNQKIAHATFITPMKPAATIRFPWVKKRHVPESLRQRGRERAYDRPYHSAFTEPKAVPLLPAAQEGDVIDVHLDTRRKRTTRRDAAGD